MLLHYKYWQCTFLQTKDIFYVAAFLFSLCLITNFNPIFQTHATFSQFRQTYSPIHEAIFELAVCFMPI